MKFRLLTPPNPSILRGKLYPAKAGAFAVAVALLVILGWCFNIALLKTALPGHASMKLNSAICLLALGAALILTDFKQIPYAKFMSRGLVLFVFVLSFASYIEALAQKNFGIDQLLIADADAIAANNIHPGLMALATSTALWIMSLAMYLLWSENRLLQYLGQYAMHVVTVFSGVALLGYLYHVEIFYRSSDFNAMAFHTAVVLFVISLGGALVRPERVIAGLLTGTGTGNDMARRLFPLLVITGVILGYITIYAHRRQWITVEYGIAVLVVSFTVVGLFLIWHTANWLNEVQAGKRAADDALIDLNRNLENTITERTNELQRSVEQLRISEEQFRGAFEYSATGKAMVGLDGRLERVNNKLCDILGYTEKELLAKNFLQLSHPEDLPEDLANLTRLQDGKIETYSMEKRFLHKTGGAIWALLNVSVVRNSKGQPVQFVAQIADISDRKRNEEALRKVNEELNTIFNSDIQVSIIGTNLTGTITHFSKGAENLLGYTAAEMVGKCTPEVVHVEEEVVQRSNELTRLHGREIKGFDVFVALARRGIFESREWTYRRKDGTTFPVQLAVAALRNTRNEITGFIGIATDITERKAAEESALKYELLEAKNKEMEQFTYIASHDLQEPLRSVSSFAGLLNEEYGNKLDDNARQYLRFIMQSTGRMSELIKGLLFYSRIGRERKLDQVDCTLLVETVLQDIDSIIKESGARITIEKLPVLSAYRVELAQLFQNLLVNAVKFRKKNVPPVVHVSAKESNGKWTFEISDNGIGIDMKDKDKIFIIFKQLHNRDQYPGTGIGLAYCKKIVELHNGNIWIDSVPGIGSKFYFTINTAFLNEAQS